MQAIGLVLLVFAMTFRQPEHHYLAGSALRRRLSRKERRSSALVLPSKKPPVIERSAKLAVQWHIIVINSITCVLACLKPSGEALRRRVRRQKRCFSALVLQFPPTDRLVCEAGRKLAATPHR